MTTQFSRVTTVFGIALLLIAFAPDRLWGQGGMPGGTGGLDTGGTGTVTDPTQDQGGGMQTGDVEGGGSGDIDPRNVVELGTIEDTRNQGFVGATAQGIQSFGFVGAASETSGPALSDGATFGGGVNSTGGAGGAGAGGGRTIGGAQQGQGVGGGFGGGLGGFGGAATQNGFSVSRQNLRTRLIPSFEVPISTNLQTANRFQSGFNRLPIASGFNGNYQVQIEGRTAILTGSVGSTADSDRLVRQLRLQPGIYNIENRLQVGQ